MSEHGRESLFQVAAAVSDGTPVNWEREKSSKPSERGTLEHLAVLERIRDLYRRPLAVPVGAAGAAGTDDTTRSARLEPARGGAPLFNWGPLRVLEEVAQGGWGIVYRAVDPSLETEVALKLLKEEVANDASAVEHFISEARRLARVHHENVLIVHGADRHGERVGMWTEFLHGQSLEAYLASHGPLSSREATLIGLDLCRALSAVHAAGLVHRDVKSSNVMREDGGRIVLMDFGSVAELARSRALGITRNIEGTPVTMAPEQLRGEVAGAATDIYGLGILLYHMVSGRYPLEAETLPELVRCHERRQYVPLRDRRADLPLPFVQVVERAISPDPVCRYPTAGAMEQALSASLGFEKHPWWEWLVQHRGAVAAAAASIAVIVALGSWMVIRNRSIHESPLLGAVSIPPPPVQQGHAALTADATLLRLAGTLEEPVPPGGRIAPGDRLSLRLRGEEAMHLYVLDEDRGGEIFVLFPIPGVELSNPIQPGLTVRLPGSKGDSALYWHVTSAGGRESLVAIGAREPIRELDSLLSFLPRASAERGVRAGAAPVAEGRTLRGIGGLEAIPETRRATARRRIEEMLSRLKMRREQAGDVWIWSTELANPAPGP